MEERTMRSLGHLCNGLFVAVVAFALIVGVSADDNAITTTTATPDQNDVVVNRLKLTLYYEALCPDSRRFVFSDLYPALTENSWLQYTDLQFVPYGKVTNWTNPDTNEVHLFCQHGHAECELNALHACIVENNSVEEQLKLINCLMINYHRTIDQCGASANIDVTAAKRCKATRTTPEILAKYGELTNAIDLSFVPSTAFDGIFNADEQNEIFYSFPKAYCRHYKQKFNTPINGC